ncbi:hypothetical protein PILCRDRAFT_68420, partial [Piloderma croceum F 1598]
VRETIIKAWRAWFRGLKEKLAVGHWTLDNAANNGTFMVELAELLHAQDIPFDAEDRRIMCFPHIVNICCQHAIKKFMDITLTDDPEQAPVVPPPNRRQSFVEAVQRDPIALGRNIVDLANYRLTEEEWSVLTDFEVILEIPHWVQQIMSGESTPILAGAIPCFEAFMSAWERLAELHPKFEPWIDAGMEYAIAYYGRMDLSMQFVSQESQNIQTVEQEYQSYITAPHSGPGTNTVKFWESSQSTYPTLFSVSLDYLPIQASAVPSERAFSSSAETDTKKRNCINLVLMEALQMLKFALKKARLDFTAGWITSENDMQEREPEEDLLAALLGNDGEDSLDKIIQDLGESDSDSEEDEDDDILL